MAQNLKPLTLTEMDELDGGRLGAAFRRHLERLANDCMDRPADEKGRKLTLTVEIKPVMDGETRECEGVSTEIAMKSNIPEHRSKTFLFKPTVGGLLVNPESPENFRQLTMHDGDE